MNTQTQWHEVKSDADLPPTEKRYLFTIENQKGERKVTLLNLRSLWVGQKVVAWREIPAPFNSTEILNCSRCGEDAICIKLEFGKYFIRVRRTTKCKADFCKTESKENESDAIADWNACFGQSDKGRAFIEG